MAAKFSTGLRNAMLGSGSLKSALADGFVHVYACTPANIPASADAAITGDHTKLLTVYGDGISAGCNLGTADAGAIGKSASESWGGTVLASGNAVFFRYVGSADTGAASTTEPRIQGLCGVSGAELNLSSLALVSGTQRQVNFASISLPA
jgi:hypothetical protein